MVTRAPLSLILALADDGTLGHEGKIPWHLPADMARFRKLTMGHAVIMGRKTWDSLPDSTRPLPGRRNIVVSKTLRFDDLPENKPWPAAVWGSLSSALEVARTTDPEPFIIGGARVYGEALPLATRIYLTKVHLRPGGDTRLDLDLTGWTEEKRQPCYLPKEGPGYTFVDLVRRAS